MKRSEDKRGELFGEKKKEEKKTRRNWKIIVCKMEFSSSFFFLILLLKAAEKFGFGCKEAFSYNRNDKIMHKAK